MIGSVSALRILSLTCEERRSPIDVLAGSRNGSRSRVRPWLLHHGLHGHLVVAHPLLGELVLGGLEGGHLIDRGVYY